MVRLFCGPLPIPADFVFSVEHGSPHVPASSSSDKMKLRHFRAVACPKPDTQVYTCRGRVETRERDNLIRGLLLIVSSSPPSHPRLSSYNLPFLCVFVSKPFWLLPRLGWVVPHLAPVLLPYHRMHAAAAVRLTAGIGNAVGPIYLLSPA
jgi:hypothetical protein